MHRLLVILVCSLVAVSFASIGPSDARGAQKGEGKIYELRTYYVLAGRMPALLRRFREHTTELFERHGMTNVGYWVPTGKESQTKLIYLLAHDSREAAEKSWKGFRDDPEWHEARDESEKDGKIVEKIESVFLTPADFSKLK